jgi:molecular chaperone GrpE
MNRPEKHACRQGSSMAEDTEQPKKELMEQARLAEERLNQLRYLQADFDNFRRLCAREKERITDMANEKLIADLLVILDDFECALPSLEQEKNRQGMEMIYKKFAKILSTYGLEPIDCVGKKFDPHFHEALCTEKCAQEQNTVLDDLGKGYRLKSKVIRPSKVKIAEHVLEDQGENNE